MGDGGEETRTPVVRNTRDYFYENAVVAQLEPAQVAQSPSQPATPPPGELAPAITRPLTTPTPTPAPSQGPARAQGPRHGSRFALILVLLVLLCLAGGISLLVAGVLSAPTSVTIAVTPQVVVREGSFSLRAVMRAPSSDGQILVQAADSISDPASATVSITPVTVQARAARGQVTFYNIAPYPQFIPAGSILTARGGSEFRTLAGAQVPAGNAPYQGSASVAAQAVLPGASGNIPTGSISMECCTGNLVNGVYAKNEGAFSGGQDAGPQYVVQQADIARAVAEVVAEPMRVAQQALDARVPPGDRLVAPSSCSPQTQASAPVGAHVQQVSVTVRVECRVQFYSWQDATSRVGALFTGQVGHDLGPHYRLQGAIALASLGTGGGSRGGNTVLIFQARGTWAYLLDRSAFARLLPQLAGKRWVDARRLLERLPGVGRVALHPAADVLPASQDIALEIAARG